MKFTNYIKKNFPQNIKGSEEEIILGLCNSTMLDMNKIMKLKLSFVLIHELIKEKNNYLAWYSLPDKK